MLSVYRYIIQLRKKKVFMQVCTEHRKSGLLLATLGMFLKDCENKNNITKQTAIL